MKVILLENIRKIGSIGDIIDVKRGFARNYLIVKKKLYTLPRKMYKKLIKLNLLQEKKIKKKRKKQKKSLNRSIKKNTQLKN